MHKQYRRTSDRGRAHTTIVGIDPKPSPCIAVFSFHFFFGRQTAKASITFHVLYRLPRFDVLVFALAGAYVRRMDDVVRQSTRSSQGAQLILKNISLIFRFCNDWSNKN